MLYQPEALFTILIKDNIQSFEIYDPWSRSEGTDQRSQGVHMRLSIDTLFDGLRKRHDGISYLNAVS